MNNENNVYTYDWSCKCICSEKISELIRNRIMVAEKKKREMKWRVNSIRNPLI